MYCPKVWDNKYWTSTKNGVTTIEIRKKREVFKKYQVFYKILLYQTLIKLIF